MDELTLMRDFRAERAEPDPTARAAARLALEARFEPAPAGAAAIPARPRGFVFRRRRLLAFAGATALASLVAGVLVLGSGPTAQPAAAEVLRETATVAAAADGPTGIPGPGQFLYMKTKQEELQEWAPGQFTASAGGLIPDTSTARGRALSKEERFTAFVPWQEEVWAAADEESRHRWVMGAPRFLSAADKSSWEQAGSPRPSPFAGEREEKGFGGARIIEARPGVMDVEGQSGAGFRDFSDLPTEPKALRQAVEHRQGSGASEGSPNYGGAAAEAVDTGQVIAELWDILDKPNTPPPLRAAVFGALAELPGIELNRDARDLVGRPGYALSYEGRKPSEYQLPGIRVEYIFDPDTAAILGRREVIADPQEVFPAENRDLFPWEEGIAAGTVRRETAYLQSGIVDSTGEKPDGRGGEPVATASAK